MNGATAILEKAVDIGLNMETGKTAAEDNIHSLVEKIQRGDKEAFKTVISLYQRKVFALAYSFFHNSEDAMDIVQETFLRLHQKAGMYKKGNNFQSWLLQITKNLCIDSYRKNHSKHASLKDGRDISELNIQDPKASEGFFSSDLRGILTDCINKLSEKQKMVFLLKQYNQMEYREIAEILNVATGTVKSLHFKAIQNLRALVSPFMENQT